MIINTKNELSFCIMADRMMNTGKFKFSTKSRILSFLNPTNSILRYLKIMRKCQYFDSKHNRGGLIGKYYRLLYVNIGRRLGFSIGYHVFGYGLMINHYGTIVVGDNNRIGNFCLIDTSTNIGGANSVIGDNFYVGPGVKIIKHVEIGSNVMVGANSVVNKSFPYGNVLIAGIPAEIKKQVIPWYDIEGGEPQRRVKAINKLKFDMQVFL